MNIHIAINLSLTLFVAVALGTTGGCTSGTDDEPLPTDLSEDTGDGSILENYIDGFDTGTGIQVCPGEFMTLGECLAVDGSWEPNDGSLPIETNICEDGQFKRCCVPDVLKNPCPYECMGAAECQERGGGLTPWSDAYQCPTFSSYDCCLGAAPPDQDTAQFMGEVFDIDSDCPIPPEDVISSEDQPDQIASGICMELMDENGPFFCPQTVYDRIVHDIELFKAAYPIFQYDPDEQFFNTFPTGGTPASPFTLLCASGLDLKTCEGFPKASWQDVLTCFGGHYEHCLFEDEINETCDQAHLWFDVGVNTKRMLSYFEEHAKGLVPGSICEMNGYIQPSLPLPGFHIVTDYGNGTLEWEARAVAQIVDCDVRFSLFTTEDTTDINLGVEVIRIENLTKETCQIPAFDPTVLPNYP